VYEVAPGRVTSRPNTSNRNMLALFFMDRTLAISLLPVNKQGYRYVASRKHPREAPRIAGATRAVFEAGHDG